MKTLMFMPCAAAALLAAGCHGGGRITLESEADRAVLRGEFQRGVYAFDDPNTVDVVLIEGEEAAPSQAVHVRMHWRPRAGRTPTDPGATNATVRYLVFSGEAAGVYSGGGFVFPQTSPGADRFRGDLRRADLRIEDHSDDFEDRLGLASASGRFTARHDPAETQRLLRTLGKRLTERLGYPRFVGVPR